jgi:hypothetical protein
MLKRFIPKTTLICCLCTALGACGEVADDVDSHPPLTTVRGTVSTSAVSPATEHPLKVAIVWVGAAARLVAVETALTPQFPAKFSLDLNEPPPPQVMVSAERIATEDLKPAIPGQFAFALGLVVAYEDLNGNDKLDLVARDAPAFIDRVAGMVETSLVFYGEGNAPAALSSEFGGPVPRGYSLLKSNPSDAEDAPVFLGFANIDAELSLALDPAAHDAWKEAMCEQHPDVLEPVETSRSATELPAVFPAEERENGDLINCSADGRTFVHRTCTSPTDTVCSAPVCESVHYTLPEGMSPPAGYPCNVKP